MTYSVVFLFDTDLQYVLLQQRIQKAFVGKWNGVGGKNRYGESDMNCAVREVREEIGVDLDLLGVRRVMTLKLPPEEDASGYNEECVLNIFSAIIDYNAPRKMPGENAPVKWHQVMKVLNEGVQSSFLAGKGDIPYAVNMAYQYYKSRRR